MLRRRTLLGGTLAVTASWLATGRAQAATVIRRPKFKVRNGFRPVMGKNGSVVRMPVQLGARIQVADPVAPGSTLTLTWDDRLYTVGPEVSLTQGRNDVLTAAAHPQTGGSAHTATLSVILPDGLKTGDEYTMAAGVLTPAVAQYPHDLVTDPVPVSLTVNGAATATDVSQPADDVARPWGATLGAAWQETTWGPGYLAYYPALVTFRAVGPAAIPAGSRLTIALDQQVFAGVEVTAALDPAGREVPGTTTAQGGQATWTTGSSIAAGERITLRLAVSTTGISGALDTFEAPVVSFTAPAAHRDSQRVTGQESLSRDDNVFSAFTAARFTNA